MTTEEELLARRSDPEARAVLSDWLLEHGRKLRDVMPAEWHGLVDDAAAAADAAADADAAAAAADAADDDDDAADADADDDDAAAAADAAADADAAAAAADAADDDDDAADADADDDDDADDDAADDADDLGKHRNIFQLFKEPQMRAGLNLVQLAGRYGYGVTLVGWMRRVSGDEWEICAGHTSVIRTQGRRTLGALASDGPKGDHVCTEPSKLREDVHRLQPRRCMPADEKAWSEFVKKPKDWRGEE